PPSQVVKSIALGRALGARQQQRSARAPSGAGAGGGCVAQRQPQPGQQAQRGFITPGNGQRKGVAGVRRQVGRVRGAGGFAQRKGGQQPAQRHAAQRGGAFAHAGLRKGGVVGGVVHRAAGK